MIRNSSRELELPIAMRWGHVAAEWQNVQVNGTVKDCRALLVELLLVMVLHREIDATKSEVSKKVNDN